MKGKRIQVYRVDEDPTSIQDILMMVAILSFLYDT
jgi:hypothetical protein